MSNKIKETIKEELQEVELIVDEESIKKYIYEIRGVKVMLDFDLARIYGYETSAFNQQIKRNILKFEGEEFMFRLTKEEVDFISISQNVTSIYQAVGTKGGRTKMPYAFTEQGTYMLMTVLKGDLATRQSRALIKVFKTMKDYINESHQLIMNTNNYIENRFASIDERFEVIEGKIDVVMDNFTDVSKLKEFLILDGCRLEADVAYKQIYALAKHSIYVIDDYISLKTLLLLKGTDKTIDIKIFSDDINRESQMLIDDYQKDTGKELCICPTNNVFHDRYIVIDYKTETECIYHCGPSSKDAGNKVATIMKSDRPELYHPLIDTLLTNK